MTAYNSVMCRSFNVRRFVRLVQERPVLYDSTVTKKLEKKDKMEKCWVDIARQMSDGFDKISKAEQLKISLKLKKKWKAMLDNMRRCYKAGTNNYYLFDLMKFTIPYLGKRFPGTTNDQKSAAVKRYSIDNGNGSGPHEPSLLTKNDLENIQPTSENVEKNIKRHRLSLLKVKSMENFPESHDNQGKDYKEDILQNINKLYSMVPENQRIDVLQDIHLVLTQAVSSTRNNCDGEEKGCFYYTQNEESVVNNLSPYNEDLYTENSLFPDSFQFMGEIFPMFNIS